MATKKRIPEMTPLQVLNRALRTGAPAAEIRNTCNDVMAAMVAEDATQGPVSSVSADFVMALHTMTARLQLLERENETLKRKLRRDNRRSSGKPAAELLKKTATPEPQPVQE